MSEAWRSEAACIDLDPGFFFPLPGENAAAEEAVAFCFECPVRISCLNYALDNNERRGVWGGTTENQRRAMRVARRTLGIAS